MDVHPMPNSASTRRVDEYSRRKSAPKSPGSGSSSAYVTAPSQNRTGSYAEVGPPAATPAWLPGPPSPAMAPSGGWPPGGVPQLLVASVANFSPRAPQDSATARTSGSLTSPRLASKWPLFGAEVSQTRLMEP